MAMSNVQIIRNTRPVRYSRLVTGQLASAYSPLRYGV